MKNIIILIGILAAFHAHSRVIISDFDDTIKISNVGNKLALVANGIFGRKTFAGMGTLFQAFHENGDQINILTASPRIAKKSVVKTLEKNEIHFDEIYLKESICGESILDYKMRTLKSLIDQAEDEVVLIGDDVDSDHKIFAEMLKAYPQKISSAYIHVVKNRPLPDGVIPYYTAYDLAVRERLNASVVATLQNELENEVNFKFIFPHYSTCPKSSAAWSWLETTEFATASQSLITLFIGYCSQR